MRSLFEILIGPMSGLERLSNDLNGSPTGLAIRRSGSPIAGDLKAFILFINIENAFF